MGAALTQDDVPVEAFLEARDAIPEPEMGALVAEAARLASMSREERLALVLDRD